MIPTCAGRWTRRRRDERRQRRTTQSRHKRQGKRAHEFDEFGFLRSAFLHIFLCELHTMSTTPQTHVRFAAASAISLLSPYSDAGSSESTNATSTFQYVNSQLIAHGFTRAPGISLEGLSSMDGENVVKCLFAMLGQVVVSVLQVYSSSGLDELIERHVTFRTIQWQIEDTSLRK